MKEIFVCPMVRSGGSLITRLFETIEGCFSYPFEFVMPTANEVPERLKTVAQKYTIQEYIAPRRSNDFDEAICQWRISRDQDACFFGKNFLRGFAGGKAKGLSVRVPWEQDLFIELLRDSWTTSGYIKFQNIHQSLAKNLGLQPNGDMNLVCFHSGNGLTINPFTFFEDDGRRMLIPIRDPKSYVATEKMKFFRQRYELNRFDNIFRVPKKLLSFGNFSDLERSLIQWEYCYARAVVLKRWFKDRVILYKHNDLVRSPSDTLSNIASQLDIGRFRLDKGLTILGQPWKGNSQFKKTNGLDQNLDQNFSVLNEREIALIEQISDRYKYSENIDDAVKVIKENSVVDEIQRILENYTRQTDILHMTGFFNREKYRSIFSEKN